MMSKFGLAACGAVVAALSSAADANPRTLPFTYTTDTLAPGEAELEQTVDLVPLRGFDMSTGTQRALYLASSFQTELEIGIAPRLELALYLTLTPTLPNFSNTAKMPSGNGAKQRLRYTLAEPGAWPIDVGFYGELAESETEFEIEAKVLLQRRFGRLRVAANLWAEYEFYFERPDTTGKHQREWVLNPTLGATVEVTPHFHIGIDSWLRGEYPTNPKPASRTFGLGPEYYVGPSVMVAFKKVWWTTAAYYRVTDRDHELGEAELYGPLWFRTMLGYDL